MGLTGKLSRDTLNYGLGQVLPKFIGFLLIPLYTTYLSPSEFGKYDLAVTVGSFLLVAMRLSLPGAITRFYYDYRDSPDEQKYITSIFRFILFVSLVTGVFSLVVGYFFVDVLVPGLPFLFLFLITVSSLFNASSEVQRKLLQVRQQSAYSAKLNIATTLVTIALSVIFVVAFNYGALGLVLATLISTFLFFVQAQFYLAKDVKDTYQPKMVKESLKFSLVLFPYHIYGHFAPLVTKSILSASASLTSVGILAVASKFYQPLTVILNAFGAAFTPHYLSIRSGEPNESLKLAALIKRIWFGSAFFFLGFCMYSDLFVLILSPSFTSSIVVVKVLALGFLPQMFYVIFSNELFFLKENKVLLVINIIGISLSVLLSWLLVKPFQEMGAAFAIIVPSWVGAVLMFFFTYRKLSFISPWLFILTIFSFVHLLVAADHYLLPENLPFAITYGVKTILLIVFLISCFYFDTAVREDMKMIWLKIKRR